MMPVIIDRRQMKWDTRSLLDAAQVPPKAMIALYAAINLLLTLLTMLSGDEGLIPAFVGFLTSLLLIVLDAGLILYCMAIRRGERAEFAALFDGFSLAGKIIALQLVIGLFVALWSMLFIIPGFVAIYRYRFALFNLLEDPDIGILKALDMSKRQTMGYKLQLFTLDLSFLGWFTLAQLPTLVLETLLYWSIFASAFSETATDLTAFLPGWAWSLLPAVFLLIFAPFFLANYKCMELGYFEVAKSTSAIGAPPRMSGDEDFSL